MRYRMKNQNQVSSNRQNTTQLDEGRKPERANVQNNKLKMINTETENQK